MVARRIPLAVLAASLALAASATAQAPAPVKVADLDPDLRCAIWSAGVLELVGETEVKTGVTAAFTYFAGRFEGSSRQSLEQAMTPEVVAATIASFPELTAECQPRMVELGNRLNALSDTLNAARPEASGESD